MKEPKIMNYMREHTNQKDAIRIGPNKLVRCITIVLVPILIWLFLHLKDFNTSYGLWCLFMLVVYELGAFITGGFSMDIGSSGITQYYYGFRLRSIPWSRVIDVLCYPRMKSDSKKVTVRILVRLEGCDPKIPSLPSPSDYFTFHMRKSLYVSHGNYAPAFERFVKNTTYIYPRN